MKKVPKILTIAGFDPSGGAGVLADIKAISALGGYGCAAITCLTLQNTRGVEAIKSVEADFVLKQIEGIVCDIKIDAIKIGVVPNREIIQGIKDILESLKEIPVVLDPVLASSANEYRFLDNETLSSMQELLFPCATVLTPNLVEGAYFLNGEEPVNIDGMALLAKNIHSKFEMRKGQLVYLKGGHLHSNTSADIAYDGAKLREFPVSKIDTNNNHGTGCTLSAAMATFIPQSKSIFHACESARNYVKETILSSKNFSIGSGAGPLNHFHKFF